MSQLMKDGFHISRGIFGNRIVKPAQCTFAFPQPLYDGEVDGIWASANGNARITTW